MLDDITNILSCSICLTPFVLKERSKICGHHFCTACLNSMKENGCAICRKNQERQDYVVDPFVVEMSQKFMKITGKVENVELNTKTMKIIAESTKNLMENIREVYDSLTDKEMMCLQQIEMELQKKKEEEECQRLAHVAKNIAVDKMNFFNQQISLLEEQELNSGNNFDQVLKKTKRVNIFLSGVNKSMCVDISMFDHLEVLFKKIFEQEPKQILVFAPLNQIILKVYKRSFIGLYSTKCALKQIIDEDYYKFSINMNQKTIGNHFDQIDEHDELFFDAKNLVSIVRLSDAHCYLTKLRLTSCNRGVSNHNSNNLNFFSCKSCSVYNICESCKDHCHYNHSTLSRSIFKEEELEDDFRTNYSIMFFLIIFTMIVPSILIISKMKMFTEFPEEADLYEARKTR
ncbi:hypothetical protein SNEBB_002991 [Seison nebaliae]|nr:hypothetical protein SNEBB_002991 [Seison nebaliae]